MADTYSSDSKDAVTKYTADYWREKLEDYKREIENKWSDQRKNLDKLYSRDQRADSADREYSIFWANIETLKPAVYARPPQPAVVPRFKDENIVATAASDVLERCLTTTFEQSDIDGCMLEVRDEFLRYGRGTARGRLSTRNDSPCVEFDQFTAKDFAHDPARSWRDVSWVAFRAWLNRDKLQARFGDVAKERGYQIQSIPLKKRDANSAAANPEDQAAVWEIWCKDSGKVHFYAEDFDPLLDEVDPWITLSSFWPCPKPAYGTLVPGKLKPVPDIIQYKDQIEEVNEYTARIAALSDSLRIRGFYPAGAGELSDAIEAAVKNTDNRSVLIPVSSFAALGGASFKDSVVWLPVDQVIVLIKSLVELRKVLIDDIYHITGLSDILRGSTDPQETAAAQQLKSQWGSLRIRDRQREIARFARDMTRIAGEIIAENFDEQTIGGMSQVQLPSLEQKQQAQAGVQQMQQQAQQQAAIQAQAAQAQGQQAPPAQMPPVPPQIQQVLNKPAFEEVLQFLADDKARGFLIDIETDSTIQPDEDAEKQRRTEFVKVVGGFVQQAFPMVQAAPQFGNFVGETLKFLAQAFRAGRPLEGSIDQLVEEIVQLATQPKPPPQPSPDVVAKAQAEKDRAAADVQKARLDMQITREKAQHDMAVNHHKFALDAKQKLLERGMDPAMADQMIGQPPAIPVHQNQPQQDVIAPLLAQLAQSMKALAAPKQAKKMPDGSWVSEPVTMQ